jgi:hypothetical protein
MHAEISCHSQGSIGQTTTASAGQKKSEPLGSSASTIDITNHIPLSDLGGHRRINIPDIPASPTADEELTSYPHTSSSPVTHPSPIQNDTHYPPVIDVLQELHQIFPTLDLLHFASALSDHGIATVDDVRNANNDLFVAIGMPAFILDTFNDCALRIAACAEGHAVSAPRHLLT